MCCPEQITSPILMQCMSPAHAVLILGDVSCQSFFPSRIARVTGMYHGHVRDVRFGSTAGSMSLSSRCLPRSSDHASKFLRLLIVQQCSSRRVVGETENV